MAFAEEARSVVRPFRRHAAFIVCYTGPNAAASRNGNEQHEDTNVGNQRSLFRRRGLRLPLPPPHSPRGAGGGAVSRFAIVALSSRLATTTPGALCSAHGIPSLDLFEVAERGWA